MGYGMEPPLSSPSIATGTLYRLLLKPRHFSNSVFYKQPFSWGFKSHRSETWDKGISHWSLYPYFYHSIYGLKCLSTFQHHCTVLQYIDIIYIKCCACTATSPFCAAVAQRRMGAYSPPQGPTTIGHLWHILSICQKCLWWQYPFKERKFTLIRVASIYILPESLHL